MSEQATVHADGGTLIGRAPVARIFALVILSLVVLLGSLLAVSAIGGHDDRSTIGAKPTTATRNSDGVLVVPKDEPKPKPKPEPKRRTERKQAAPVVTSSASSSAASAVSASTPAPAPVQSAPAPAPTPAPAPAPAANPAPKKQAPVQHRVVVTE